MVTDDEILKMMKVDSSKEKGFVLLMDRYKKPVYFHVRRLLDSHDDAQDVLQETFIQVYKYAGSFKGESKLFTWIYKIATNECIRLLKKRRVETQFNEEYEGGDMEYSDNRDPEWIMKRLYNAIERLPEKQRLVFNLRYFDDMRNNDFFDVPDGFFDNITQVTLQKAKHRVVLEKKRRLRITFVSFSAAAVLLVMFVVNIQKQSDNSIDDVISKLSDEELSELERVYRADAFLYEQDF